MRRAARVLAWTVLAFLADAPAFARPPLSYLSGFGTKAYPVVALTWGLIVISVAVVVIISVLLVGGIWRRRAANPSDMSSLPLERSGETLGWLYWGVGVSIVTLVGSLVWTVVVLAAVNGPPSKPPLTIEITGQQWWWKVRYISDEPSREIITANEIHIPVGQPVRVKLIGADVIHSFWIPALTGKTDTIPGQTNTTWLEANKAGIYRGQCTEYCGLQHAHMAAFVVAEAPDKFQAWRDAQILPAAEPASDKATRGRKDFEFHCGACHKVRGSEAGGTVAPDLTHLMSRNTIAAGTLDNTVANLSGWIANPQAIKPGTLMPALFLSAPEFDDIRSYLETLK